MSARSRRVEPGDGIADDLWSAVDSIDGWLTRDQAATLHRAASRLAPGERAVEIGSHLGRSAAAIASALPQGARLSAVDPFGSTWRYGRTGTREAFTANMQALGLAERVDLRAQTSRAALKEWREGPVAMVYVDGKHDALSLIHDVSWSRHLKPGGALFVHDCFSSLGVTLGLMLRMPFSSRLKYVGRTGSLAEFAATRPGLGDRLALVVPLGWFARNLLVKVTLRARWSAASRALGHHDAADPY